MAWGRKDDRDPLERALEGARGLKPGAWESVETLAILALASRDRPEARALYDTGLEASRSLSVGSWQSVRALALLAHAAREPGIAG